MSDVRERLTEKALSALEALADIWASEVSLVEMCGKIASTPKIIRSDRVREMCIQCFVEGAYRARLDALAALDEQAQEIARLRAQGGGLTMNEMNGIAGRVQNLRAERDAAREEVERLKEAASKGTEYVLAQINEELRGEVERLKEQLGSTRRSLALLRADIAGSAHGQQWHFDWIDMIDAAIAEQGGRKGCLNTGFT